MVGNKHLTEAVDTSNIKAGVLNLIQAPCGSGKSHFALHKLPELVSKNSKLLYVIDTVNGREQQLKQENTTPCGEGWEALMQYGKQDYYEIGEPDFELYDENKIVVITYALFGSLARRIPHFGNWFEIIVCDELHSGVEMTGFSDKRNTHNYARLAIEKIKQLVYYTDIKVIAMTATPTRLEKEFTGYINKIPVDKDVYRYETKRTEEYSHMDSLLAQLKGQKGLIYTPLIWDMKRIQEKAAACGIKAVCVWSLYNKDHDMTQEQMSARDYIIENEQLPPGYDAIIINKSNETGINIRGQVDYILMDSTEEDVREQVRGRYRGDLNTLYLKQGNKVTITDQKTTASAPLIVPEEYLNRPLSAEERKVLSVYFNVRNESGRCVGWTTINRLLVTQGNYTTTELARGKDDKRYWRIEKTTPKNTDTNSKP